VCQVPQPGIQVSLIKAPKSLEGVVSLLMLTVGKGKLTKAM